MQRRSAHWNCILETWTCSSPRKVGGYWLVHCFKKVSVMPSKEITLRSIMTNMAFNPSISLLISKNPLVKMVDACQCYYLKFWRSKLRYRNNLNNHLIEICNFISHFRATFRRPWRMNCLGMCSDRDSITWSTEESPCAKGKRLNQPELWKDWPTGNSFIFFSTKEWLRFKRKETGLKKTWWGKKGSAMFYCHSSPSNT